MEKINKMNKKGFTIVELVIVLAVIGVLAGVLIPTFSNIIRKSQISADVQLARNLNTVLATAAAQGRIPSSMYDVLYLENEAGYVIQNLNPTNQDYYFAWDSANNKIVYLMDDLQTVYFPEDYKLDATTCWITVGSAAEAQKVNQYGYNLALENDIQEEIKLNNVVSIDTLGFTCSSVEFQTNEGSLITSGNVTLSGTFTTISGNVGNVSVTQSGVASTVEITGSTSASVTVSGYVNNYSASGVASTVSSSGLVSTVESTSTSVITGTGVVKNDASGQSQVATTTTEGNTVIVDSKETLDSIRTQLSSGLRNYSGEFVKQGSDINLNGIALTPMSNFSRDKRDDTSVTSKWFQGTYDGGGFTIQNFSNEGFSITGINSGTNESSVPFGETKVTYSEAVYGLFGTVYNATIKNLNITCSIDMEIDNANKYVGDSVGGLIGFAYGNTVTIENCSVSGSIKGYDGVAAFVGRCYAKNLKFINCTNYANVTGARKTAGFCGTTSNCTVTFDNCTNNGTITCLGIQRDVDLIAWGSSGKITNNPSENGTGYYKAAAAYASGSNITSFSQPGFTNNGKVYIGSEEVTYISL